MSKYNVAISSFILLFTFSFVNAGQADDKVIYDNQVNTLSKISSEVKTNAAEDVGRKLQKQAANLKTAEAQTAIEADFAKLSPRDFGNKYESLYRFRVSSSSSRDDMADTTKYEAIYKVIDNDFKAFMKSTPVKGGDVMKAYYEKYRPYYDDNNFGIRGIILNYFLSEMTGKSERYIPLFRYTTIVMNKDYTFFTTLFYNSFNLKYNDTLSYGGIYLPVKDIYDNLSLIDHEYMRTQLAPRLTNKTEPSSLNREEDAILRTTTHDLLWVVNNQLEKNKKMPETSYLKQDSDIMESHLLTILADSGDSLIPDTHEKVIKGFNKVVSNEDKQNAARIVSNLSSSEFFNMPSLKAHTGDIFELMKQKGLI